MPSKTPHKLTQKLKHPMGVSKFTLKPQVKNDPNTEIILNKLLELKETLGDALPSIQIYRDIIPQFDGEPNISYYTRTNLIVNFLYKKNILSETYRMKSIKRLLNNRVYSNMNNNSSNNNNTTTGGSRRRRRTLKTRKQPRRHRK